jgi:hypothetical protein
MDEGVRRSGENDFLIFFFLLPGLFFKENLTLPFALN